jgi:hypothetical protein
MAHQSAAGQERPVTSLLLLSFMGPVDSVTERKLKANNSA